MDAKSFMKRICVKVTDVGGKRFNHEYAHDCFCAVVENSIPANLYHIDEKVVKFIEAAIDEKIDRERENKNVKYEK